MAYSVKWAALRTNPWRIAKVTGDTLRCRKLRTLLTSQAENRPLDTCAERLKIIAAQPSVVSRQSHASNRKFPGAISAELVKAIVGCFLGDDDVVNVAFAEPRGGDANEPGPLAEFFQGRAPAITHA